MLEPPVTPAFPYVRHAALACLLLGALVSVSALTAATVRAQTIDAVLVGSVTDELGAPLVGVTLLATPGATGVTRSTVTDAEGRYVFLTLPAGTYDIRATLDGFAPSIRQAQTLYVGTRVRIDFSLPFAGLAERVTVRGTLPLLQTSAHSLTRLVQTAEIDALPLVSRNFNDLAALAPGVTKTGVYGGVDINGRSDFQNAYYVDGVSAERHHLGDQRVPYAQDWIQEFQVITGQSGAEFGQAAGGVLNVITRSGGNDVAGRVYGFVRDDAWDATPALVDRAPPLREYRLGATVGGPLVTNRLFYFAGIERFDNASSSVVNSSFPSENGVFPFTDRQTLGLAKLDLVASPSQQVRVRYNGQRARTTGAAIGGTGTREHGRFSDTRASDTAVNWTWVTSPSALNEVRAAWSAATPRGGCNYATDHPPGTWFERAYPAAQFGCPVNFGTIAENQLQLIHNLTWTHGRHEIKVGTQAYWTRSFGDFRNFRDGQYTFDRDRPFRLEDTASYPFQFVAIEGASTWDVSSWSGALFVQDRWRVAEDVTLTSGVRYDVDGTLTALNSLLRRREGRHRIDTDLNNLAPRLGVAWTPFGAGSHTVIRGGVGLFYDQNHNNVTTTVLLNNILVDRIVAVNANSPLLNPFWPDIAAARRLLAESLNRGEVPERSALGSIPASINDVDRSLQIPGTWQYTAGVAREFGERVHVSADVVGVQGFDLHVIRNVNVDPMTYQRLDPEYSAINAYGNGGWSVYKALQIQATVMPAAGRLLKVAYTLATHRTNTHTTLSAGTATNPFDFSEDEGPANNDVRHTIAVSGSLVAPLGIQVSGIWSYRSALPYSAVTSAPRPDGTPFSFRPEPPNARRGDSAQSLDVRLAKAVTLGTAVKASAFLEVFNLTNQVNYGGYIGTVTSTLFGQPTSAAPKRRSQLGLRLEF